jgi:ribosomal protein S18 acetylase RimI-like enzyme
MIPRDWRALDPAIICRAYEREKQHWQANLGWDTARIWATIEEARIARFLPGFVAFDETGLARGWTFVVIDKDYLHIGGLVADSPTTTAVLLDAALGESAHVDACFILNRAEGLERALDDRGFDVERFHYLYRHLPESVVGVLAVPACDPPGNVLETWQDGTDRDVAALLEVAYPGESGIHFAPDGNWSRYVSGLVQHAGCGVFDATLSRVVRNGKRLAAAVVATSLSATTAHIAQLAVHPDSRGCGLATLLVERTIAAATAAGKTVITLLVGERNTAALALYKSLEFTSSAVFVAARRDRAIVAHRSIAS